MKFNLVGSKKKTQVHQKKTKKKSIIREYTETLLFVLVTVFILRTFVIEAFRIPTGSMEDTLLIGDFLFVNKFIYGPRTPDHIPLLNIKLPWVRLPGLREPRRGDVIVFKYPRNEKLDYIKRCIAVGGDTVEIRNKQVYVNGKLVPLPPHGKVGPYVIPKGQLEYGIYPPGAGNRDNYGPVVVPKNCYFMMGDNRDNSADSRYWGFLPRDNILGKALIIYFSWDKDVPLYRFFKKVRWSRIGDIIR
ncbi:signal peptidase I [candidate division KSB1 bacterium]|nr:MAG: signal peptidase I [candidate division KSB1 bacterium]